MILDCQPDIACSLRAADSLTDAIQPSPPTICPAVLWWFLGTLGFVFTDVILYLSGGSALRQILKEALYLPCWACLLLFVGCLQRAVPTRLLNISLLTLLLSPFAVWGLGSRNCYLLAMSLAWHLALLLLYFHFSSFLAYGEYRENTGKLKHKSLQIRVFMLYLVIAPFLGDLAAGVCFGLKKTVDLQLILPDILSLPATSPVNAGIIACFLAVYSCFFAWSINKCLGERT